MHWVNVLRGPEGGDAEGAVVPLILKNVSSEGLCDSLHDDGSLGVIP